MDAEQAGPLQSSFSRACAWRRGNGRGRRRTRDEECRYMPYVTMNDKEDAEVNDELRGAQSNLKQNRERSRVAG